MSLDNLDFGGQVSVGMCVGAGIYLGVRYCKKSRGCNIRKSQFSSNLCNLMILFDFVNQPSQPHSYVLVGFLIINGHNFY